MLRTVAAACSAFLLGGCAYTAPLAHAPFFDRGGETHLSAALGTTGVGATAARSFDNGVGLLADGSVGVGPLTSATSHVSGNAAIGVFRRSPSSLWRFEAFGGFGGGRSTGTRCFDGCPAGLFSNGETVTGNFLRGFAQGDVALVASEHERRMELGLVGRLAYVRFRTASRETAHPLSYDLFPEVFWILRFGTTIQLELQAGYAWPVLRKTTSSGLLPVAQASVGVRMRLGD